MNKHDNPFNIFPKGQYKAKMVHLHPGNSTKHDRENSKYFSYLKVHPINNPDDVLIVTAKCSKGDTPNREKAREVLRLKARVMKEAKGWI